MINLLLIEIFFCFIFVLKYSQISKFLKLLDKSDGKLKKHHENIPSIGGLIFFVNYCIFFLLILFNFLKAEDFFQLNLFTKKGFFLFFISSFFIYILGIVDDLHNLNANIKTQFILLFILMGIYLNPAFLVNTLNLSFYKTIYLEEFSLFFTLVSIFLLMNFFNMFDGINGNAGIFFLIVIFYICFKVSNISLFIIFVIPSICFLYLNIKNKIFLGNNGSYFLSYILGIIIIYLYNTSKVFYADEIFILLFLPFLDMMRLFITRIFAGKNPLKGDRNHLHHLTEKKFGNLLANFISMIIVMLPILFFNIFKNFYFAIILSIFLYCLIFCIAKKNYKF